MPDPTIGAGFNSDIAYRYKPGQTAAEFYSQKSGQTFGSADQLASYVNTNYQGANATKDNVFGVLAGGYTPRAEALKKITDQLNQGQTQTFSEQSAPKRASSSLQDSINTDQGNIDSALAEFNTLKTKLSSLTAPNYEQSYNELRTKQGLPQIESDVAANNKAIRELPYVNRQNSGNAGVTTEGQLAADTQQKGIPLEIQQANLLDHLKLAQDFVTNSLNLKEKDYATSREGLATAIDLVGKTLEMSRQHLSDLTAKDTEQKKREELAQKFGFENRITAPFYDIGGTVYRTSDRMPAHNKEEYIAMGGTGDFSDVQKISPQSKPVEVNAGNTLIDPATGKVIYQAPNKSITPRGSSSGGGGSGSGTLGLTNQQIDNIAPLITQFQNSPTVKNYNVLGETLNFVNSLSNSTKNPTDDQALIYSIAKALDPDSVVREGEYSTVQKYAQSWAQAYGKSVEQAFLGTGFLSETARKNIKTTLETRFRATESSYKNLYRETERRVNLIGNTDKGSQLLNNYGGAFAPTNSASSIAGPVNPNASPAAAPQAPAAQGFWNKTINWLFGN